MTSSRSTLLFALICAVANAHICMWAPVQRKGFSIETPGESLCYLKEGPCGGVPSAEPQTTLAGGNAFTVFFQQNLNHYYIDNPGKLVVDFASKADPAESDFTELAKPIADYNAMNEITQTNFTLKVVIPDIDAEHAVVRLRYISQNPTENDRGMTFYQCADVKVVKTGTHLRAAPQPAPSMPSSTESECCAPAQFTLDGYETSSWRKDTFKKFYFDAVNKLFRVDTISGSGTTIKDGHFQMISNFTSGIEYYYNVVSGTCSLYGLNYWSDWCYGTVNQQVLTQSFNVGDKAVHLWTQENTPFQWTNVHDSCVPFSMSRTDTHEITMFSNMKVGAPDPAVFTIPSACKRAEEALRGEKRSLPKPPASHESFPTRR